MWLNHPAYRPARDQLISRFRAGSFQFRKRQRIAFICGGNASRRRGEIEAYLKARRPDTLFFRAEAVWEEVSASAPNGAANALELEQRLADLADMVIIVVESAGTLAELGAFALHPALRKKLLPILDTKYRHERSFVNMGPVHWIDSESLFAPAIYADFDVIARAGHEIETRLDLIRRSRDEEITSLAGNPQHRLFVLWDLVAAIGPVTKSHIAYFYTAIFGATDAADLEFSLGLGLALGVLRKSSRRGREDLYFREVIDGVLSSSFKKTHSKAFDLSQERARIIAILLKIPSGRRALAALSEPPC